MLDIIRELIGYAQVGGFVMPPLMLLTLLLWFAIGYRYTALKRGSARSVRVLIDRYRKGQQHEPKGILDHAVVHGLEVQAQRPRYMRRHLDDAFASYEAEMRRYAVVITSVVAVAPLLGLLGTVVGMIETFESLGDMSLFSQSGGIAGGISQALFTTQMGLAIAIPGLVVKGILDKRQQRLEVELAQLKDILCAT